MGIAVVLIYRIAGWMREREGERENATGYGIRLHVQILAPSSLAV